MPRKVFVAGEILTAADVNTNLMDQAVMVFDNSAARGSAIPSPSEGMITYLKDTDEVEKYTTAWESVNTFGVIQVVSTTKTTTFSTTSATFVDVTGLSVSITPTSTSSKILVMANIGDAENSLITEVYGRLMRDSTAIYTELVDYVYVNGAFWQMTPIYLDSPASTSALTYKMQIRRSAGTCSVNLSSITAMEIAG